MSIYPTEVYYCSREIGEITQWNLDWPWQIHKVNFTSQEDEKWVSKAIGYYSEYWEHLDNDTLSDSFFDALIVKHSISNEERDRARYGLSIKLSNGTFVWPSSLTLKNEWYQWRDGGEVSAINFYKTTDLHGYLSNFSKHGFEIDGVYWPTVEHYYQSAKFNFGIPEILAAKTAFEAAKLGRIPSPLMRTDWDNVRYNIMKAGVLAKFAQNEDIQHNIASTASNQLIEHTSNDKYWADAGDGTGKNMLGICLMSVRNQLIIHGS